ncbi:MAG TPA: HypC/HybG/HupF family hydrogenase formation chaperone [Planctomycetaceae bacterium]|nr:HypC/HybG/HupF family hydrogenase formation chaperone [Planctomycetaceae bacterium]HIQ23099.1 HypC/HybG/HupF family hydrogenase formation chaperone [Planctomycetota bacterium]
MCLGIPGRIVEVYQQDGLPMGKVEFGGVARETCLAFTPEAEVGDYVIVHAGFAISRLDEREADEVLRYLAEAEGGVETADPQLPEEQDA